MSFRARLLAVSGALSVLLALLVLGIFLSPDTVQARTSTRPLLEGVSAQKIDGIDIAGHGETTISLRRTAAGWESSFGARTYPGSTDRITTFLRTVTGLQRTSLVSGDAKHLAELGLSVERARRLVLHQVGGGDAALLVGRRGPGGDADYVQVQGETRAFLARGSLAFFLAQERAYWYELHVLPDDVQGATIASVTVRGGISLADAGSIRGDYTLRRPLQEKPDQWVVGNPERPADRVLAGAMANALALLEGVGFAEGPDDQSTSSGAGRLDMSVRTFAGKTYSITVKPGGGAGWVRITTSWSPWTYIVNALLLPRVVLPESKLTPR